MLFVGIVCHPNAARAQSAAPIAEEADTQGSNDAEPNKNKDTQVVSNTDSTQDAWDSTAADDWDTDTGEVDRKPHISGVMQASFRAAFFAADAQGIRRPDSNAFQLEHNHVKLSGDITHELSWEIMPCLTHMNTFSVVTANFAYAFGSALHLVAGRFLLPFGQFNARSLPGTYNTVSRPLLYLSHEDGIAEFAGITASPFFFTPRDDLGLQANGNVWFGGSHFQLSYAASVTNGLRPESPTMARFWNDNNKAKQVAGRATLGIFAGPFSITAGGSGLWNQYHEALGQTALGGDLEIQLTYAEGRSAVIRGEVVRMDREVIPNEKLLKGRETIQSAYGTFELDLTSWLAMYYELDWLEEITPDVNAALVPYYKSKSVMRHTGGVGFRFAEAVVLRLEYGHWQVHDTLGAVHIAHLLSAQTVLTF